jgi:hypothetical protein
VAIFNQRDLTTYSIINSPCAPKDNTNLWRSFDPCLAFQGCELRPIAEREHLVNVASACVAWERSASRLNRDETSHGLPNQKYALTVARIRVHYLIDGEFLGAGGEANRDNNYFLDHVARLRVIADHIVHGRYDRVCHLYRAEALSGPCAMPAITRSIISSRHT